MMTLVSGLQAGSGQRRHRPEIFDRPEWCGAHLWCVAAGCGDGAACDSPCAAAPNECAEGSYLHFAQPSAHGGYLHFAARWALATESSERGGVRVQICDMQILPRAGRAWAPWLLRPLLVSGWIRAQRPRSPKRGE
jgi:hypothetical protein